jgi:hypothetical protein
VTPKAVQDAIGGLHCLAIVICGDDQHGEVSGSFK